MSIQIFFTNRKSHVIIFRKREHKIMTIYFYTRQKNVCRKLAYILEEDENVCCIYTKESEFYTAVANMKKYPELLLLDYLVYNHDAFNIYRFMSDIGCKIPLLFYNDPYPQPEALVQHWIMMLNLYYSDTGIDTEQYSQTLQHLSDAVNSKELRQHISLMQAPEPCPDSETGCINSSSADPQTQKEKDITIRGHIPNSLYSIFRILYAHRERAVSITDIQFLLHEKNIEVTANTIYSNISRLRTFLRTSGNSGIDICRTRTGYSLFIIDEKC